MRFFIEKYSPRCCLCGIRVDWTTFFPKKYGKDRDDLTIHHLNHNREVNTPENLALCHRDCHRRHHREEQLFREVNPNKKYIYRAYISEDKEVTKIFKV
jgi:5-methylcytosine-specific restriction endonuclease McrA